MSLGLTRQSARHAPLMAAARSQTAPAARSSCRRQACVLLLVLGGHSLLLWAGVSQGITVPPTPPALLDVFWEQPAAPTAAPPSPPPRAPQPPTPPRHRPTPEHRQPAASPAPLAATQTTALAPSLPATPDNPLTPGSPGTASSNSAPPQPSPPRFDADYLNNPAPDYPRLSRELGEAGRVLLRVHVTAQGNPDDIQLHQGSGYERLDHAARQAVRQWRFIPARLGSEAQPGWVLVPINFSLRR